MLLVLGVVALGMRSMNRRESSLPPERLKEMAEKEERTKTRSTDEFAAHEPKMTKFSPDFSPIDEPKPRPVRTGQRGKRGVDEWGNPRSDEDDEEFWASIRSDAEEGGFGAGGTVAARKAASRPAGREPAAADRPSDAGRSAQRPAPRRPRPAPVDPDATTVQGPLPQRPAKAPSPAPAAASSGLADLVEPVRQRPAPSASDLADQRTVTFAAPTSDVMSILGAGAQPVPSSRPDPLRTTGSFPAQGSSQQPSGGSYPVTPAAVDPASSGSFPAVPAAPISGAPTSDPFPAYNGGAAASTGRQSGSWPAQPAATASGGWPTASPDILDDPAPASQSGSWPGFQEQQPYRSSYEVRAGWAVADDSDPLSGPSPASAPAASARPVPAYDDVLSAPLTAPAPQTMAYETGDFTSPAVSQPAWPAPPAGTGYGADAYGVADARNGNRRTTPEQEFPDYYR
ncbi:hypothetical protein OUY22_16215 [Nonomuraea sp. MCN248]|uniref:Uncharacterized protein n=1 Tax=Nonomuraea corallina TaxID=2989783 RepID=A0ABT4SCR9_9ACTN|nr:hypothetical protein [Nonomuraea corallina]MDA0634967.1 hypothetical protein [Nonomuraea corallina]